MTVPSEANRAGPYTGNGVTTIFGYSFRILDQDHIKVIRSLDGVDTILSRDADYTVAGVGNIGGGQISMFLAPTASNTITILRDVPFTQETDLENQGPFFAETIEAALDLSVMRDQQITQMIDDKLAPGEATLDFDARGRRIINLASPVADTDAVNKAYVDASSIPVSEATVNLLAPKANPVFSGKTTTPAAVVGGLPNSNVQYYFTGGEPTISQYSSGLQENWLQTLNMSPVSGVTPEGCLVLNYHKSVGYANKLTAFAQGFHVNGIVSGEGPYIWGGVININYDTTAHNDLSVIGLEIDFNNANSDHFAPGGPDYSTGILLAAPNYGFVSAAAITIESAGKNWNYGVAFNGGNSVRQSTIYDNSQSVTSFEIDQPHNIGIDAVLSTFTSYFLRGNQGLFTVDGAGIVRAPALITTGNNASLILGDRAGLNGWVIFSDSGVLTFLQSSVGVRLTLDNGTGNLKSEGSISTIGGPVSGLPAPTVSLRGHRRYVTDASSPTFMGGVTGGGSSVVPVFCTGTAWVVA